MKKRKVKLILVLATVLLLLFTSLNIFASYVKMKKTVEESIANQSLEAAISIASAMDIETYKKFLENPVRNEYYWEIRRYLNDAREKLGALYVYTLKIDNPKISKAMVVGASSNDYMFEDYPIAEDTIIPKEQIGLAFYTGRTFVSGSLQDARYGNYLTVGAPIKDETGKSIGYLAVDISTNTLDEIKGKVLKNNILLFVFNGVVILVVVASFLALQRWYQKEVAKEIEVTEDVYQGEIKTLITSVSSLRHDFTNHIQVLYGLIQLGEFERAQKYIETLSKEVRAIESLKLNIDHPGLSILLQTKKLAAQNYNIDMEFTISHDSFAKMKTTDLIKILSNLIDNAIDATIELPENERKITICCNADDNLYEFTIMNTGPSIADKDQIFKQGFSTKKAEQGKIRGQGLFIVREIVRKYDGAISIESTNDLETTAIVKIPL
ncbi:GHKL domain-containing protein [Lysinibacillus sp. NPDC096418]|uniref:GHKL domain-containing protein n=1 Tax=Lysinibacillus sp. NPDC096418 TaxID=3364138 RepID=UPI0038087BFF